MKFKTEVTLLVASILLFALSVFLYSYQGATVTAESAASSAGLVSYPYRGLALAFVGFGSISMVTASVSYTKRSKNLLQ